MSNADLPEELEQQVREWSSAARRECERDQWFWMRQRATIVTRARQRGGSQYLLPLMATAVTVVTALGLLLASPDAAPKAVTSPSTPSMEAVLQQAETNLEREVPEALAPVTLLTQQLDAHAAQNSTSPKEKKNEM
jgi:hypothetical protein